MVFYSRSTYESFEHRGDDIFINYNYNLNDYSNLTPPDYKEKTDFFTLPVLNKIYEIASHSGAYVFLSLPVVH